MMEVIAATNNLNKLAEMRRILEKLGHTVQSQREAGITIDPVETGATFAENALIKAEAIGNITHKATIADDSGLCVAALGGAPGVYSARYCGRHGDDEANNEKLLAALSGTPQNQRGAKFVSSICVRFADGRHFIFEGECSGEIAFARRGTNGFGYDPLFIPDFIGVGEDTIENTKRRTYAQLDDAEKDAISHRGAALRAMQKNLPEIIENTQIIGDVSSMCY
ncbi:MAG: RdgB/HAM1 family non-canonical purine NTP pyrophosphatase, partial [Ruthenibacterium sp.]